MNCHIETGIAPVSVFKWIGTRVNVRRSTLPSPLKRASFEFETGATSVLLHA